MPCQRKDVFNSAPHLHPQAPRLVHLYRELQGSPVFLLGEWMQGKVAVDFTGQLISVSHRVVSALSQQMVRFDLGATDGPVQ